MLYLGLHSIISGVQSGGTELLHTDGYLYRTLDGVQVDSNTAKEAYWWMVARLNAEWAEVHGYEYIVYCSTQRQCVHPDSKEQRAPQWCKLVALAGRAAISCLPSD